MTLPAPGTSAVAMMVIAAGAGATVSAAHMDTMLEAVEELAAEFERSVDQAVTDMTPWPVDVVDARAGPEGVEMLWRHRPTGDPVPMDLVILMDGEPIAWHALEAVRDSNGSFANGTMDDSDLFRVVLDVPADATLTVLHGRPAVLELTPSREGIAVERSDA